ncbi:MAG TPA: PRC-barrel domain-containing protein [Methylomirabilota bacterium]|jgi:sporulation protein YlmC with PRC-barrel domain
MKDLLLALVTCVVVGVPLGVAAQAPARPPRPIWRELGLSEARTVLGMRIKNEQGRDVGELDNLLIDTQSGRISHVVIGVGGFMGVGEKKVVVPWSDLKIGSEGNRPVATLEQAKLESAPRWDRIVSDELERPAASPTTTR